MEWGWGLLALFLILGYSSAALIFMGNWTLATATGTGASITAVGIYAYTRW